LALLASGFWIQVALTGVKRPLYKARVTASKAKWSRAYNGYLYLYLRTYVAVLYGHSGSGVWKRVASVTAVAVAQVKGNGNGFVLVTVMAPGAVGSTV
jgi:hypothetical protein